MNRLKTELVRRLPRLAVCIALGAATIAASSCADSTPDPKTAGKLALPRWNGPMRDLFPNEIEPAALGQGSPQKVTRSDRTLWARATSADVVGRARVQTFTVDTRAGVETYRLGIQFANPTLATPKTDDRVFDLTIGPSDAAYGVMKILDRSVQGKTFVAFVKRFAGADDEIEVHYYLSPDSAEVASVIQEAVAVEEVSRK